MLRFFLTYRGVRVESKQNGRYLPAENWKEIERIIKRSSKYAGITYLVSSELTFSGPFVNIIDQIKANGLGEEAFIEIWKKNQITNVWESKFVGLIDVLGTKKEISVTGREVYVINTSPVGFERDFDNNFDVNVNITSENDLSDNPIIDFQRPFDWIGLKALTLKKNLDVEAIVDKFDAGSELEIDDVSDYYYFLTANHETERKQEFGDKYQNNPTLIYEDHDWTGPDPRDPFNHEDVLNDAPHSPTNNGLYLLKAQVSGDYKLTWQWDYDFLIETKIIVPPTIIIERYYYWTLVVIVNRDDINNVTMTIDQINTQGQQGINSGAQSFENKGVISKNYTLATNEELYLIPYFTVHSKNEDLFSSKISYSQFKFNVNIDKIVIEAITKFEDTNASAYLIHELFSRLTNKLTGQFNAFTSNFYGRTDSQPQQYEEDGEGSLTAIMNGKHLRGWQIGEEPGESVLSLSFQQLFESEKAKHNIDLGIFDGKVIIEKLDYFYDVNNFSIDLGCIRDLEISTDSKLFYNSIEVGYSDWKNSENKTGAGLQEFNVSKTQTTQLKVVNSKYKALSNFIAGGYPIETTRQEQKKFDDKKETQNDFKKFMIALERTSKDIEDADNTSPAFYNETFKVGESSNPWQSVSGVDFPEEVYNVRWQPSRIIRNHGNQLRLSVKQSNNDEILAQDTPGNKEFSSQLKAESLPVKESENIKGADLGDELFTGERFSFETSLSDEQIESILSNPYKHIKFSDAKGNERKGVIPKGEQLTISIISNVASFNLLGIK